jgi:Zn-dependent M28 family amino/carboxypeptidase
VAAITLRGSIESMPKAPLLSTISALILMAACSSPRQQTQAPPEISGERIAAHVRALADDEMEGRGPASHGETLAVEYLKSQFQQAGAVPADAAGSYLQSVPLVGVETLPDTRLSWEQGGSAIPMTYLNDYVAINQRQQEEVEIDAEAVFVGHGIRAPEFGWNDYENTDVKGKLVVLFTNEPPSDDPAFFGGRALTYYGRWVFKYEEALRQGALGAIIVHTTGSAGYPWQVVRNSWGIQNPFVRLDAGAPALAVAGWVSSEIGAKLFEKTGKSVDEMLQLADTKGFRPMPLGLRLKGRIHSTVTPFETHNVLAKIEGSDPVRKNEAVLYTAHWDHLGVGFEVDGDKIYNGAADNATGCGVLLEMARAFAALEPKPARTVIFAAVSAEEGGLRGSEYYAQHPVVPAGRTALDLNYDGLLPLGRVQSVALLGYERTTVKPLVDEVAHQLGLEIEPDDHPEQGYYYRSDHFSLAKAGVPAFSFKLGTKIEGKSAEWAEQAHQDYIAHRYHQPSDEFDPTWDFSGLEQLAQFGFEIGRRVANLPELPSWQPGDEFLPARERSLAGAADSSGGH